MTSYAARVFHTAHSPDDGGVGLFSTVKWVSFQLSKFRPTHASGYFFGRQMGLFSLDKNSKFWRGKETAAKVALWGKKKSMAYEMNRAAILATMLQEIRLR